MVIDDYHPHGDAVDRMRMQREASRLFRGEGNQAGRGRMASDRSLKSGRYPRCLLLATGEDLIPGQSLNSRLLITELLEGDITKDKLTQCQRLADAGLYAEATSAFICWAAPELPAIQREFRERVSILQAAFNAQHPRLAHVRAQLIATYQIVAQFLLDYHVIAASEVEGFGTRIGDALRKVTELQKNFGAAIANPCTRFQELLLSAITSGAAHLADIDGDCPEGLETACGWRREDIPGKGICNDDKYRWRPQGTRIGWVDTSNDKVKLYLDPTASYAVAKKASSGDNAVEVSDFTLRKRLHEANLLASTEQKTKRGTLTVRRRLQGATSDVLDIKPEFLHLSEDEPSN